VKANIQELLKTSELVFGGEGNFKPTGEGTEKGAFIEPHLLVCRNPENGCGAHDIEAFGPVATIIPYNTLDEAVELVAKGRGSLVTTVTTRDPVTIAKLAPALAAYHGRLHLLDAEAAKESTGHGSPLPMLKHGGPGRAGGGEELGGIRAVYHYLQRTAIQGSPTMLAAVTGEYIRGAKVIENDIHPFRYHFEDLQINQSLLTHRRTVTEADLVNFGCLSGDHFYMHFDEIAAKNSQFGKRIAHGYFVLSAAAGLFVDPGEGPVLANYGLDTLRFIEPVAPGDTIRARLTCKRKIDQGRTSPDGHPQGVVVWDVQVTNQEDELVASYDILTLVAKKPE
jgi:oxepin-CoA hydrolase/3-oxo-5,6-dehydrosuberyl-CoA semialdehyde dehydrogenase